jgi:ribosomal protein S18 acetylase RimI-like enzyme
MRISLRHNISPLIMRLQAFLRATAAPGREVVELSPFTAYFHPTDSLKYLNYAIPDDDSEPTSAEIERLREEFRRRERLPRLEWIEEAAPLAAGALDRAGMGEELRTPLMALAPDELVQPEVEDAIVTVVAEDELREAADIQRVAFGGTPHAEDQAPAPPNGGLVLARIRGEAASVAQWTPVIDSCSEIVGVATAEAWRRRGLAGLVTAATTRAAFEAGAETCVLSPGDETALRVYARAGFRRVATMLHYSDLSSADT